MLDGSVDERENRIIEDRYNSRSALCDLYFICAVLAIEEINVEHFQWLRKAFRDISSGGESFPKLINILVNLCIIVDAK